MNNTEKFSYEVPIINLNVELIPKLLNEAEDQDCTIIEPNSTNDAPIVIDDDEKDNDCSVIDDHIDSAENVTRCNANRCHESSTNDCTELQESSSFKSNEHSSNLVEKSCYFDVPIILDEDSDRENDCSVISMDIISHEKHPKTKTSNKIANFEEIYKQDTVLAELTEKCLDMENSTGMLRIINKTLLPIYKNTSDKFKKSASFQRILTRTLMRLETEPHQKFSHLKEFCEVMKSELYCASLDPKNPVKTSVGKKRVKLTTLKRKLNGKFSSNKTFSSIGTSSKKKMKVPIINVDDDDDDDILILNGDTDIQINDVRSYKQAADTTSTRISSICHYHVEITSNTHKNTSDNVNEYSETDDVTNEHSEKNYASNVYSKIDEDVILIEDENHNSGKVNVSVASEQSINTTNSRVPFLKCAEKKQNGHIFNTVPEIGLYNDEEIDTKNKLTNIGHIPEAVPNVTTPDHKDTIKDLEEQIKTLKKKIDELEIKEVNWNSSNSSYIETEFYKSKIVTLYKQLCKLTGTEFVKRHKVRLKAVEGRHKGPTLLLEQFINENIDKDGNPPFPDMLDVVKCVNQANEMYQLGWSRREIVKEAQALFVHYGRTVQKRRQKREWKDLMQYHKEENVDPADNDPMLTARLEDNAKLALKNEMDLINRYAQMQYSNPNCNIATISSESSESDHESVVDETSMASNKGLLENETATNNGIVPHNITSNSNKESNSVAIYINTSQCDQQLNISPQLSCPIKNIVTDKNINILGDVTTPLNNETLKNKEHNLKDICEQLDSRSTAKSTIKRTGKNIIEINNEINVNLNSKDIETKEVYIAMGNDAVDGQNFDGNENSDAFIDVKPNITDIEVAKSVQYDEVSTSFTTEITLNVGTNKNLINDNEVSSNEIYTENSELLNNTEVEAGYKLCDNVDNEVSSETKRKTCEIVNNNSLEIEDKVYGLKNNIETSNSENMTCNFFFNNAGPLQTSSLLNDTESKAENNTIEVVNVAGSSNDLSEIVKSEKLDIPKMLEALGDNYTVTIIDIEDPFEVIEISESESSDSEDDL